MPASLNKYILILFLFVCTSHAIGSEKWYDRVDLFGYADVVYGENRYDSDTGGFDAYHFTTNMNIRLMDKWRV